MSGGLWSWAGLFSLLESWGNRRVLLWSRSFRSWMRSSTSTEIRENLWGINSFKYLNRPESREIHSRRRIRKLHPDLWRPLGNSSTTRGRLSSTWEYLSQDISLRARWGLRPRSRTRWESSWHLTRKWHPASLRTLENFIKKYLRFKTCRLSSHLSEKPQTTFKVTRFYPRISSEAGLCSKTSSTFEKQVKTKSWNVEWPPWNIL